MDPAERELPSSGEALFVDPESELTVPASIADVRVAYRNTVEEVIGEWRVDVRRARHRLRGRLDRRAVRRSAPPRLRGAPAAAVSFLAPLYLLLGGADRRAADHPPDAAARRRARRVSRRRAISRAPRRSTAARSACEISY